MFLNKKQDFKNSLFCSKNIKEKIVEPEGLLSTVFKLFYWKNSSAFPRPFYLQIFLEKTLCEREERIFESSHLLIFQLSACVSIYDVIGPSGEIREPLSHRTLGVR